MKLTSTMPSMRRRASLDHIFLPRTVAMVGASETAGSVGRTILENLITDFKGPIFPVNPKRDTVLGLKAYPTIDAIGQKVSLAVIATPAHTVPGVIVDCVAAGVGGAIVISAGFSELGAEGESLQRQIVESAQGKMRIIGPNCLGVMNPLIGLNATFANTIARRGKVAFLSQSGALCTAILDWSLRECVGFSAFISTGAMADVGWGDWIDYLGNDPSTKSILIYMESIGDARAFLSAAREVALSKPIIVIKAGRTEQAAKAAASHTGALTGSDEVLDAAFRRAGVLRVRNIADLFYMADLLGKQPPPNGPRLTIVTNAGGPGVLATDSLIGNGGELAALDATTMAKLNAILPAQWSHNNPIDVLGDAGPERYAAAIAAAVADPNSDGLLAILTPQAMTDPVATAEALAPYAATGKPILASWMGGPAMQAGDDILHRAGIPTFPYPDTAAHAFLYMWRYTYALRGLYETPAAVADLQASTEEAADIITGAMADRRTLLDEEESKRLLASYGIPVTKTEIAASADQAVGVAEQMGFPVVLKVHSRTITHKTDVGGVKLNLSTAGEVRSAFAEIEASVLAIKGAGHFQGVTVQPMVKNGDAYEIILGSSVDPQFGPVLLFGAGGQLVEIWKDRALALPPLNATLARRMMEQTKIHQALKGIRGRRPVNLPALEELLVRFSRLVVEHRRIKEIDINPLLVGPGQILALDARVVLFGPETPDSMLPHPAIRPYPNHYHWAKMLADGTTANLRPIRAQDEPLLRRFHETLSERTVELRYFHLIKLSQRIAHDRLTRICFNDYDREIALVAERRDPRTGEPEILAVARLSKEPGGAEAEYAVLVSDRWQRQGLGSELTRRCVEIAKFEGIGAVVATVLPQNREMAAIFERLGFQISDDPEEGLIKAKLPLRS